MSSTMRFQLVRDHLVVISNRDLESVRRCVDTERLRACSDWDLFAKALSNKYANKMTSADRKERLTQ